MAYDVIAFVVLEEFCSQDLEDGLSNYSSPFRPYKLGLLQSPRTSILHVYMIKVNLLYIVEIVINARLIFSCDHLIMSFNRDVMPIIFFDILLSLYLVEIGWQSKICNQTNSQ